MYLVTGTLPGWSLSPGGNFVVPIFPHPIIAFNYYEDSLTTLGSPPGDPILSLPFQPYPWVVNATMHLQNNQTYAMEQQLVVPPSPVAWGKTPVTYIETNGLLTITLLCSTCNCCPLLVNNTFIRATLDPVNIPPPLPTTAWPLAYNIFTNWSWPLEPNNTPSSSHTIPGSAGTEQASLYLPIQGTTIANQGLLVRANRSYTLNLYYQLYNGNQNIWMPVLTTNTGVVPSCTNMQITFCTTNCSAKPGETNAPCYTNIVGLIDMLGTPTDPPGISITANGVGFMLNNQWIGNSFTEILTGAALTPLPASFLMNVVASDSYSYPGDPYHVSAWEYLDRFTTGCEYFSSPVLYPVYVPCLKGVDLTNIFVMCPTNPAIVEGNISLCGPVDTNYYPQCALAYLQFNHVNPDTASYIEATGGASAAPPWYSTGGGDAITAFDNPGNFNGLNSYSGNYRLRLAGLQGQPSIWSPNHLRLVFGPPVDLAYSITNTGPQFNNVTNFCATSLTNNITNCFGLLTFTVVNENYPSDPNALPYDKVKLEVSGTGPGYTVGPFTVTNTAVPGPPNKAVFKLFLPEGNYTIIPHPHITYPNGENWLDVAPTNCSVTCVCTNCVQINCTNISLCSFTNVVLTNYPVTAVDTCLGVSVPVQFTPAPPHSFAPGTVTTVNCTAGGASCSFTVTVVAGQPQALALYSTGVNASHNPLNGGDADPHYLLGFNPDGQNGFVVVDPDATVMQAWLPDTTTSQWIGPRRDGNGVKSNYVYRVTFDVCSNYNYAVINGRWAVDNSGLIELNGIPISDAGGTLAGNSTANFNTWHPFTITSGFVSGQNTLDFYVTNSGGFTGLRVELSGNACCCTNCCEPPWNPTNCCTNCAAPYPITSTVTVVPGWNFLVNPLCRGTNNTVGALLPNVPDETQLLRWTGTMWEAQLLFEFGAWTYTSSGANASGERLEPGDGFVLSNPDGAYTLTFMGCEPDPACKRCGPTNVWSLVGRLGSGPSQATWPDLFRCPPKCGTEMLIWNGTSYVTYTYYDSQWHPGPGSPSWPAGMSVLVSVQANTNCCTNVCNFGYKFNDLNHDGVRQTDEPGLSNWPIHANDNATGQLVASTVTDANGFYHFHLPCGTYTFKEGSMPNWVQTCPSTGYYIVTVDGG
ncbi:MAG: hypothetical protein NT154_05370, partial [Verrucomicrobia bacterium]|nr:hypothetical protein [Verrucomicrobiota bacterium]